MTLKIDDKHKMMTIQMYLAWMDIWYRRQAIKCVVPARQITILLSCKTNNNPARQITILKDFCPVRQITIILS
jgi:hypothetical protein